MRRTGFAVSLTLAATLALGACSEEATEDGDVTVQESRSLASMLAGDDDLEMVAGAMSDAGLAQVFDGAAYYTLLAPTDAAFEAAGAPDDVAGDEQQRAALVAIMRDHILPGYLTSDDISAAIDSNGGSVEIHTMGEDSLTFSKEGEHIRVTGEDGATAVILAEEARAGNGVLLPVDGILKKL